MTGAGGHPGRPPAQAGPARGLLQAGSDNLQGRAETARSPEEPELLSPQPGPAASSPGARRGCTGRGGGVCAGRGPPAAVGARPGRRPPSAKELTGLSASSRPRLLHPPHYLHFITAGAAAREAEGRQGFLRRPGLPAAAGPSCPPARRGRGLRGPRSAQVCGRAPACCPPACCPPAGGWERGWGDARGRRAERAERAGGRASASARRSPAGMRHGRGLREDAVAA